MGSASLRGDEKLFWWGYRLVDIQYILCIVFILYRWAISLCQRCQKGSFLKDSERVSAVVDCNNRVF